MKQTVTPFLSEIIDYAGLYPPASLSLEHAFAKYIEHSTSPYSWMLSKFVIGSDKLRDFEKLISAHPELAFPVDLSIVAPLTTEFDEFKHAITSVVKEIALLHKKLKGKVRTSTLEIKLPVEAIYTTSPVDTIKAIDYAVKVMSRSVVLPHRLFFEVPGFDFDFKMTEKVIRLIAAHNEKIQTMNLPHYIFSGLKIRCGGVEAHQFPPSRYLAKAVLSGRDENVAIKFTAGLHHPIRHYNESVKTKMHGFLNVFGASILSYTQDLSEAEFVEILNDEKPSNFKFTDQYFAWKDFAAPALEIRMLRMLSVLSYGSCSFDEPIEDLQKLKIL